MSASSKPASTRRPAALSRTRPCAQGQAFSPLASTPTARRTPRADAAAMPMIVTGVLRGQTADRRHPLAREARLDRHLGAQRLLALEDVRGDVLCELLCEQGLADHDLLDRLPEQLRKAGHVHALLRRIQVDRALDVRGHELLVLTPAEADRLVDAANAGARETDAHLGGGRL